LTDPQIYDLAAVAFIRDGGRATIDDNAVLTRDTVIRP